jgi:hypothetical protein
MIGGEISLGFLSKDNMFGIYTDLQHGGYDETDTSSFSGSRIGISGIFLFFPKQLIFNDKSILESTEFYRLKVKQPAIESLRAC